MNTTYTLTAQPIDDHGQIGFEYRDVIEISDTRLDRVFKKMSLELGGIEFDEREPNAHTEKGAAWDLTLMVK